MLEAIPENQVFPLDAVRFSLDDAEHPWVVSERAAIEAHWAREQVERPYLFNGTILMHRGLRLTDGLITGTSHRVPYAALLHLVRTWPEADVFHLFGSPVILSSDGAMLLIRMGANTANPGRVYAPAGSLDLSDITGTQVDLDGGIYREAMEETGLDLSLHEPENRMFCWRRRGLVALFRRFACTETADRLAARMRAHIATAPEQEIEDVVIVRRPEDAGPTVPPYMQAMIDFHFDGPGFNSGWQA